MTFAEGGRGVSRKISEINDFPEKRLTDMIIVKTFMRQKFLVQIYYAKIATIANLPQKSVNIAKLN